MLGPESIDTIEELLAHPKANSAQVLELCICDAVHFRLIRALPVFKLVEERLCQRDPVLFKGFSELRSSIEKTQRGAPIKDKVDTCCVKRGEWVSHRQILYSTELEVWMDIAYPNPWALALYHEALKHGKLVYIPKQGPFTELFHKMLLQKSGYERLAPSLDGKESIAVYIGEQASLPSDCLHFVPPGSIDSYQHSCFSSTSLSGQMMSGVLIRDRENQSSRKIPEDTALFHEVGYRLIGPTLLLLIQALKEISFPVAFTGMGSGFLTTLCQNLKHPWPWLPDITNPQSADMRLAIFPEKSVSKSLIPAREDEFPSILPLEQFDPVHLLHPAISTFMEAFLKGSGASTMQAAAAAFLNDYARATRGLYMPVAAEPVFKEWQIALLSPDARFLKVFAKRGVLPGFRSGGLFSSNLKSIKSGAWPTGTFLTSTGISKLCLRLCAPERVKGIRRRIKELSRSSTKDS